MPWEKFEVKAKSGAPTITISRTGRISFSEAGRRAYRLDRFPWVELLFDREQPAIGFRLNSDREDDRTRVRLKFGETGASLSAKVFLDYYGVDYTSGSGLLKLDLEMKTSDSILVAAIPRERYKPRPGYDERRASSTDHFADSDVDQV